MRALIGLIQPAFEWTWHNSVQVALLVGLVLVVQKVLGRWLTPRLRYALSLLILLRLLLPAVPSSPLSLENLFRPAARLEAHSLPPERGRLGKTSLPEASLPDAPVTPMVAEPAPVASATPIPGITPFVSAPPSRWPAFSVAEVLGLAWACGLLVLVSLAGWRYAQWCRLIRQGRRLSEPRLLALLDDARQALGVRRPVTLVAMPQLGSPAVFGFRRVRLLLPETALDQLTDQELRLLFLHEMAHVRRHDMLLNLLLMAVQYVHWFNPLLWLGLHRLRADRELVCDAMVLQRTRPEERSGYGLLLLKLLTDFPTDQAIIPTAVPVVSSHSELKRRIVLIKHQRSASRGVYLATVMAVVALASLTFTGSSEEPAAGQPALLPASTPGDPRLLQSTNLLVGTQDAQTRADIDKDIPLVEGIRRANEQFPDVEPLTEPEVVAAVRHIKTAHPDILEEIYETYQRVVRENVLPRGMYFSHKETMQTEYDRFEVDWKDLTLLPAGTHLGFNYRIRARFISSQPRRVAVLPATKKRPGAGQPGATKASQATSAHPLIDLVEAGKDLAWGNGWIMHVAKREGSSLEGIRIVIKAPDGQEKTLVAETGMVSKGPDDNSVKLILYKVQGQSSNNSWTAEEYMLLLRMEGVSSP